MREDFRMFKLNRMTELTAGEPFEPRSAPLPDLEPERIFPAKYQVTVLFDQSCRWRLVGGVRGRSFHRGTGRPAAL